MSRNAITLLLTSSNLYRSMTTCRHRWDKVLQKEKGIWALMLQCNGKLNDYIDVRLTELQIGWSDLLIMCIIRTSDYEPSACHHADLNQLRHRISLDVWRLYIQRMDWWGSKSETGRLTGILETCREYWGLNLSLSLEDWENFSIVHASLTLSAFSRVAVIEHG